MALWAIMRLQMFGEGFRTASSTVEEKKMCTLSPDEYYITTKMKEHH